MTPLRTNLGAVRSSVWADFYAANPSTSWRESSEVPKATVATFAATALALASLSTSSPLAQPLHRHSVLFPQSSSAQPNDAVVAKASVQRALSTGERLAAVQSTFGLNKTQLAEVCSVKRQTIYDWYAGNFEAEGENASRLYSLYGLVVTMRDAGLHPVPPRSVDRPLTKEGSLLRLLCRERIDTDAVQRAVAQLQSISPSSARSRREQLGWGPLTEEQQQEQLDSNLDYLIDG
jgi:DNA-binding XRE family transcriptional regulator